MNIEISITILLYVVGLFTLTLGVVMLLFPTHNKIGFKITYILIGLSMIATSILITTSSSQGTISGLNHTDQIYHKLLDGKTISGSEWSELSGEHVEAFLPHNTAVFDARASEFIKRQVSEGQLKQLLAKRNLVVEIRLRTITNSIVLENQR